MKVHGPEDDAADERLELEVRAAAGDAARRDILRRHGYSDRDIRDYLAHLDGTFRRDVVDLD